MPLPTKVQIEEALRVLVSADKQGLITAKERACLGDIVHGKTDLEHLAYARNTLQLYSKNRIQISKEHRANLERIVQANANDSTDGSQDTDPVLVKD